MQTEQQLNLKQKVAFVAILCLLCSLPLLWIVKERAAKEAEYVAAQTAARIERDNAARAKAKLAKRAAKKSTKRKKKMVKILRGQSGQADYLHGDTAGILGSWKILTNGEAFVAWDESPNGWGLTPTGVVTVPADASDGIYKAVYINGENIPEDPGFHRGDTFEFEVVCMKVTLRLVPTNTTQ